MTRNLLTALLGLLIGACPSPAASDGRLPWRAPDFREEREARGCAIPQADDVLPATAKLVLELSGDGGEPFVVRLSSAGTGDAIVHRAALMGDVIDTEIIQLELSGTHPRAGPLELQASPTLQSLGQIRNVELDGSCQFVGADAFFDVYVEIQVPDAGETWFNQDPLRVEGRLASLPPEDGALESPRSATVAMLDAASLETRGQIRYQRIQLDPSFPAPGPDCHETQLSADLSLTGPAIATTLTGLGTTTVQRGTPLPRTCSGTPDLCDADSDCPGLVNVCPPPKIQTEISQLEINGNDPALGDWQLHVIPPSGESDCCIAHPTPGCTDPSCEEVICAQDSFCCESEWDSLCASLAAGDPTCAPNCFDPNALPSAGEIQADDAEATFPATSTTGLYVRIETQQEGDFFTPGTDEISLEALSIGTLPWGPGTTHASAPAAPATLVNDDLDPVGNLSDVVHVSQLPVDCSPPSPEGDDCVSGWLHAHVDLPSCPTESLSFPGSLRLLRDSPADPGGTGQEAIPTLAAWGSFGATSPCAGPLNLRLSPSGTSAGQTASLTPEEFFPADSYLDLVFEIEVAGAPLSGGPARLETTINALPPPTGERYLGPDSSIDLLNDSQVKVGEVLEIALEIASPITCPADSVATLVFPGPTRNELSVSIPAGGGGVVYDVVRGDLGFLRVTAGSFITAQCLRTDGGPDLVDGDAPDPGDGFYYVARDGFGSFNGTWNSPGPAQSVDRDPRITTPPCP